MKTEESEIQNKKNVRLISSWKEFVLQFLFLLAMIYFFIRELYSPYNIIYFFSILLIILQFVNYIVEQMEVEEKHPELMKLLNRFGRILLLIIVGAFAYFYFFIMPKYT